MLGALIKVPFFSFWLWRGATKWT